MMTPSPAEERALLLAREIRARVVRAWGKSEASNAYLAGSYDLTDAMQHAVDTLTSELSREREQRDAEIAAAFDEAFRSGWQSGRANEPMTDQYAKQSWEASDIAASIRAQGEGK